MTWVRLAASAFQIKGIGPTLAGMNGEGGPHIDWDIWMSNSFTRGEPPRLRSLCGQLTFVENSPNSVPVSREGESHCTAFDRVALTI
jgi:hypothetical protein